MNVRRNTLYRVLITPKVYPCLKLKSVLEILYYLLCLKALRSISVIARLKKKSDVLQLCLIFGSISKLIIVKSILALAWIKQGDRFNHIYFVLPSGWIKAFMCASVCKFVRYICLGTLLVTSKMPFFHSSFSSEIAWI